MKPARFEYAAPQSVDEAITLLADGNASVLAGGQSLVFEMVYREATPSALVDINRVPGLDRVVRDGDLLRIGALVRHADLERASADDPVRRLLARAAPYVAHPPIRARGTFAGSVAWAHPAAEWNAVVTALGGAVYLQSVDGAREVRAADWYLGERVTSRRPDELVVEVSLPVPAPPCGVGFAEHRRTHASFAEVAVAVLVRGEGPIVASANIGIVGIGPIPVRASDVERALRGGRLHDAAAIAHHALSRADGNNYRQAVTAELTRRAVRQAVAELEDTT